MWEKLKELLKSKKTIMMVITIVGALCSALADIITAKECFEICAAACGLNLAAIGLQDFGKSAADDLKKKK